MKLQGEKYRLDKVRVLGEDLLAARLEAGLSQEQLADCLTSLGARGNWYQRKIARMESRYENTLSQRTFELFKKALAAS